MPTLPAFSERGKPTNHNLIYFLLYAFFYEYFYMLFDELEKLFLYIDFWVWLICILRVYVNKPIFKKNLLKIIKVIKKNF